MDQFYLLLTVVICQSSVVSNKNCAIVGLLFQIIQRFEEKNHETILLIEN